MYQIYTLYTLNSHHVIYQLYYNKAWKNIRGLASEKIWSSCSLSITENLFSPLSFYHSWCQLHQQASPLTTSNSNSLYSSKMIHNLQTSHSHIIPKKNRGQKKQWFLLVVPKLCILGTAFTLTQSGSLTIYYVRRNKICWYIKSSERLILSKPRLEEEYNFPININLLWTRRKRQTLQRQLNPF